MIGESKAASFERHNDLLRRQLDPTLAPSAPLPTTMSLSERETLLDLWFDFALHRIAFPTNMAFQELVETFVDALTPSVHPRPSSDKFLKSLEQLDTIWKEEVQSEDISVAVVKATRQAMQELADWSAAKIKAGDIGKKPSEENLAFYEKLMESIEAAAAAENP
ncbi:hypothetical protein BGZ83_011296 [Gryganskiella cystojenkinii]|nr:hypothetical protein BGZ83_011296 [Gryganskiella cystojenkinii]